jgi:hypothetical protein
MGKQWMALALWLFWEPWLLMKTFYFYCLSDWKGVDAARMSDWWQVTKSTVVILLDFDEERGGS